MGGTDSEAAEQIRRIRRDVQRSVNDLDVGSLGNHLADDVTMMPAGGPRISGAQAVVDYHRDYYGTVIEMDIEFSIERITIIGGLAVEKGTYQQTMLHSGDDKPEHNSGRYLYTYERGQDDSWEIHRLCWE